MNQEQQRIKIAEACGWNYEKREVWPKRRPKQFQYVLQSPLQDIKVLPEFTVATVPDGEDNIVGINRLPDYLNDLNAMHEAEKALTDAQYKRYIICLAFVLKVGRTAHSTASQRAESFLRTLNLWTDEPTAKLP